MTNEHTSAGARLAMCHGHPFKLGLFGLNMNSATFPTTIPERWNPSWEANLSVATLADDEGLDFLLPVGRWKGVGGSTLNAGGNSFETITWACGLLGQTKNISIFSTVHTPLIHPLVAAKQFVTADHIGQGRFGINLVVGWNEAEFAMFGIESAQSERYAYTTEWLDIVTRIWSAKEDFDYNGKYFRLRGVQGTPKPYGDTRPILLNAGKSEVGQAFAIERCDGLFSNPRSGGSYDEFAETIKAIRRQASFKTGPYPIIAPMTVVCRPTKQEADDFFAYCLANFDHEAAGNMRDLRAGAGKAVPRLEDVGKQGFGGFRLVGDADYVAGEMLKLSQAGVDGAAMVFINAGLELPFFIEEVLPRMKRAGLRN